MPTVITTKAQTNLRIITGPPSELENLKLAAIGIALRKASRRTTRSRAGSRESCVKPREAVSHVAGSRATGGRRRPSEQPVLTPILDVELPPLPPYFAHGWAFELLQL